MYKLCLVFLSFVFFLVALGTAIMSIWHTTCYLLFSFAVTVSHRGIDRARTTFTMNYTTNHTDQNRDEIVKTKENLCLWLLTVFLWFVFVFF
jgi:hypothetical protein